LACTVIRVRLLTSISGADAPNDRPWTETRVIGLDDLKRNKRASGRHNDLADLDHLP
jgi:hypothetical protein